MVEVLAVLGKKKEQKNERKKERRKRGLCGVNKYLSRCIGGDRWCNLRF